jgi:hypothetical protein
MFLAATAFLKASSDGPPEEGASRESHKLGPAQLILIPIRAALVPPLARIFTGMDRQSVLPEFAVAFHPRSQTSWGRWGNNAYPHFFPFLLRKE